MRTKNTPAPRTKKATPKAPQLRKLATSDIRRLARPKAGFAQYLEPLLQLLETYGDELGKCPVDPAAMRAALAQANELAPVRQETAEKLALIDNTVLASLSSVWTQMLVIYAQARAGARTNAEIRAAIDAFEQFMKTGPHKPAKPNSTSP